MESRPSWDQYFMNIARQVSTRATCDRRHVGCVLVLNNRLLTSGYNGSIPGTPHCDDAGHLIVDNHCVRTLHAEENAVIQAANLGIKIIGCAAYSTDRPCWHCVKIMASAGVINAFWQDNYRNDPYPGQGQNSDGSWDVGTLHIRRILT